MRRVRSDAVRPGGGGVAARAGSTAGRTVAAGRAVAVAGLTTLALMVLPAVALGQECANAEIREQQGMTYLPDCMALEMVSPPSKGNTSAIWAAIGASGDRVRFLSRTALGGTEGYEDPFNGDFYVATRGGRGWTTSSTAPPAAYNRPGAPGAFAWEPDFDRWYLPVGTNSDFLQGIFRVAEGGVGQPWVWRSPLLASSSTVPNSFYHAGFQGTSSDGSHLVFTPGLLTAYLPGDPVPTGSTSPGNAYVLADGPDGEPGLALLSRDSDGVAHGGNCGAALGGGLSVTEVSPFGNLNQGAVSGDGSRMYLSARAAQPVTGDCNTVNKLRILERRETPSGIEIDQLFASECDRGAPACDLADGDDFFQGASVDGTKVYFTTSRQLTDSDLDTGAACSNAFAAATGCDLYLYDSTRPEGERLTQVSAGDETSPTPGAGAQVPRSIVAVSGDGSHVYFVAGGVLTTDQNDHGQAATAGQPNLYVYQRDTEHPDGRIAFVGTLDGACGFVPGSFASDCNRVFGSEEQTFENNTAAVPFFGEDDEGNEVGGDGHVLVFLSRARLTPDDSDDNVDAFRYRADSGELVRVSKAGPGGSDNGAHEVWERGGGTRNPLGGDRVERYRWVSEDGESIVFVTRERLTERDYGGLAAAYLWRDGELTALPGTGSSDTRADATLQSQELPDEPVVSRSGDMVAFGTLDRLLPQDGDIARDIYVARVGGGFEAEPEVTPCAPLVDGCQGPGGSALGTGGQTADGGDRNAASVARARLSVGRLGVAQRRRLASGGRVYLRARVNGAGSVRLHGRGVRPVTVTAGAAGVARVGVRLRPRALRRLERRGRLSVPLAISFSRASEGGSARVVRASRTLVLKRSASSSGRGRS